MTRRNSMVVLFAALGSFALLALLLLLFPPRPTRERPPVVGTGDSKPPVDDAVAGPPQAAGQAEAERAVEAALAAVRAEGLPAVARLAPPAREPLEQIESLLAEANAKLRLDLRLSAGTLRADPKDPRLVTFEVRPCSGEHRYTFFTEGERVLLAGDDSPAARVAEASPALAQFPADRFADLADELARPAWLRRLAVDLPAVTVGGETFSDGGHELFVLRYGLAANPLRIDAVQLLTLSTERDRLTVQIAALESPWEVQARLSEDKGSLRELLSISGLTAEEFFLQRLAALQEDLTTAEPAP